jgi:hypothetical protein
MTYILLFLTIVSLVLNFLLYSVMVTLVKRNLELGDEYTWRFVKTEKIKKN